MNITSFSLSILLDGVIAHGHRVLCNPVISALQYHGLVPCLLLGTLWILSGCMRLLELKRTRKARLMAPSKDTANSRNDGTCRCSPPSTEMPAVSIVFPVRGCRSYSKLNWESVVAQEYGTNKQHKICIYIYPSPLSLPPILGPAQILIDIFIYFFTDMELVLFPADLDGPLEFIFVLEDCSDAAYSVVCRLVDRISADPLKRRRGRVVCSGPSTTSSQKIHK